MGQIMLEFGTIEDRVRRGAKCLDKEFPGWYDRIDLDTFRMEDGNRCVLGKLYGSYQTGMQQIYPRVIVSSGPWCSLGEYHGWNEKTGDDRHKMLSELQAEWVRIIESRRGGSNVQKVC